jgi:hypothetical protein
MIETESMLWYISRARESEPGVKEESIMSPSGDVQRYVGMAGYVEGYSKESAEVNLLSTAPGKRIL